MSTIDNSLLICFAVKEEASPFLKNARGRCRVCITGMGEDNARRALCKALLKFKPKRVITAGFAGGLNPKLKCGHVLYDEDSNAGFAIKLRQSGARPGTFHCSRRIAVTGEEKKLLWELTGADAVEMESAAIRAICQEKEIPSATIRVISDDAAQDMPLDFNTLMTSEYRLNHPKLFWRILVRPGTIPKLIEFQRQTKTAAAQLGIVLEKLLAKT